MIPKPRTIAFWQGRLPHWEVEEGRYFITINQSGAIPQQARARIYRVSAESARVVSKCPESWLKIQRTIFREIENWLDRAQQDAYFQHPEIATMILEAIEHRQTRGDWRLFEYVVMPTHIHLFLELVNVGLKEALEDFKRWTGHEAAKLLGIKRSRLWQREWFDHWSRSDEQDERIAAYIGMNPVKAGLVKNPSDWPYGSAYRKRPVAD